MKQNDAMIGGFRVLTEIHGGGQGKIVKAVCEAPPFEGIESGTVVALKVMPVSQNECEWRWTRLKERTDALAKLSHPNVVKYFGCFREKSAVSEIHVVVMEYLPDITGSTLRDAIKSATGAHLSWQKVFGAFMRYANALAAIHKQGIVHRNIKPSKLYYKPSKFRDCSPDVKILYSSIARDVNGVKETGAVPGTLDYMPQEVVLTDNRGDYGMDIYALGLSLYEALTGKTAYPRLPSGAAAFAACYERANCFYAVPCTCMASCVSDCNCRDWTRGFRYGLARLEIGYQDKLGRSV
ncbi:MAG: protein kinase [Kiritimatiellae bacterium]|nr:protein kinase [Kiritimatiellia bacterium]